MGSVPADVDNGGRCRLVHQWEPDRRLLQEHSSDCDCHIPDVRVSVRISGHCLSLLDSPDWVGLQPAYPISVLAAYRVHLGLLPLVPLRNRVDR